MNKTPALLALLPLALIISAGCISQMNKTVECYSAVDCEGNSHGTCNGSWDCVEGKCAWDCGPATTTTIPPGSKNGHCGGPDGVRCKDGLTCIFDSPCVNCVGVGGICQVDESAVSLERLFATYYEPVEYEVRYNPPDYRLPLDAARIYNINHVETFLKLDAGEKSSLAHNGVIVIRNPYNPREDGITDVYTNLKDAEIPVFITSDSLLHLYHIQFDETLRTVEEQQFYDFAWNISRRLLEENNRGYAQSSGEIKEAYRRNMAFFSVAMSLLAPAPDQSCLEDEYGQGYSDKWECMNDESKFPHAEYVLYRFNASPEVKDNVDAELALIRRHDGFSASPLFGYKEDYSQYVPRGHYTRSEKLKNYFKALMWYGRMSFLLKESPIISKEDARMQTLQASLIASQLMTDPDAKRMWDNIYAVTSFYVGFSDDLGPYEYREALGKVFGGQVPCESGCPLGETCYSSQLCSTGPSGTVCGKQTGDLLCHKPCSTDQDCPGGQYCRTVTMWSGDTGSDARLCLSKPFAPEDLNESSLEQLKAELATYRAPKIYGGTGDCEVTPGSRDGILACLEATKGLRLMGQRFIPDSYMFQNLVNSGNVGFYTGAQPVPFTYGESTRVFPRGLDVMVLLGSKRARDIEKSAKDDAYQNYSTAYGRLEDEFNGFTPEEWNRNLYWSYLYSLQPLLADFNESHPAFMRSDAWKDKELLTALAAWTELRHDTILYAKQSYTMRETAMPDILPEKPVVGYVEPVPEFYARLLALTRMTTRGLDDLGAIDETSRYRLKKLESVLKRLLDISAQELRNRELSQEDYDFIKNFDASLNGVIQDVDEKAKKTTIIADVHTDSNSGQVLEEGVGYVNIAVVAYQLPDGRVLAGAGPVFTYYEFKHPMGDRLTDEGWRTMLETNPPSPPEWALNAT
ncbi:MAG: DUF3160 domain-containing protein [Candidatus Altiarchaeota archaeon]|nr:DUF3160 domain-containing protein [Candidatus Altiarchaeota archaeon]